MAKITSLMILNPADKTRMFSIAIGKGAPLDDTDPIVTNIKAFPIGSQYTDLTGKNFYVRVSALNVASDWHKVNGETATPPTTTTPEPTPGGGGTVLD